MGWPDLDGEPIGLSEAAGLLGVHYMTAYRYVRLGRLPAEHHHGRWIIRPRDLRRLKEAPIGPPGRGRTNWARRQRSLVDRLAAGDGPGSWGLVESALAGGASPGEIYLKLIGPSLEQIGEQWAAGTTTVEQEHRATTVALRLVGRIGPRFTRPGRPRPGTVVLGAAPGDPHLIPVTMVADVLRGAGLRVVDLGANVPRRSFLEAAATSRRPLTIGISLSVDSSARAASITIASLRHADPATVVLAGGPAVTTRAAALNLGAHDWAPDAVRAAHLLRASSAKPTSTTSRRSGAAKDSHQDAPAGIR